MNEQQQSVQSWWPSAERAGFSGECRTRFQNDFLPVPMDDVSPAEAQAMQRRGDLLATLVGVQAGKSNGAIRRAVTL